MGDTHDPPPSKLRIALIQACPEPLDAERNFKVASNHIRDASSQGASLAVLPEYHLTGWYPEDNRFKRLAAEADAYLKRYQQLAKECSINIVPGTIVTLSSGRLLNKTYFISTTGEILGDYTKANVWHPEREFLTSGPDHARANMEHETEAVNHHSVIQTPIGPVGLLICFDLMFPEAFRALVKAGARTIIIPTYSKSDDISERASRINAIGEELYTRSTLITRAFENTCCIVFCNVGGPKEEHYMGLSQVVMPLIGPVPGSFDVSEAGMKIVDVDMDAVDAAEENYKIRQDLAKPGFHY